MDLQSVRPTEVRICLAKSSTSNRRVEERNSGILPDSWRGHSVRAPAQVDNLRDKSSKMPELRSVQPRHICHRFYLYKTVSAKSAIHFATNLRGTDGEPVH